MVHFLLIKVPLLLLWTRLEYPKDLPPVSAGPVAVTVVSPVVGIVAVVAVVGVSLRVSISGGSRLSLGLPLLSAPVAIAIPVRIAPAAVVSPVVGGIVVSV